MPQAIEDWALKLEYVSSDPNNCVAEISGPIRFSFYIKLGEILNYNIGSKEQ